MIKLSELNETDLIEYMKLYGRCTVKQRNELFFIALKNHLMFLKRTSLKSYGKKYTFLKDLLNDLNSIDIVENIKENNGISSYSYSIDSIQDILNLIQFCDVEYKDNYTKSLAINFSLYKNNMCPLIFYSFGKWIELKEMKEDDLRKVMEFSMMSLYKIIRNKMKETTTEQQVEDKGSVSRILLKSHPNKKKMVYKIPKSLGSKEILAQQEYDIYRELINTDMKDFIAGNYMFDAQEKILSHEFIEGKDGEYYLFNHIELSKEQEESLKKFYYVYSNRERKDIILDIHPGNFVWSEQRRQWIIVDLGAIPEIGSDYYQFEEFEGYYDFVWKQRETMMKKVPIRSMDFGIDLEIQ